MQLRSIELNLPGAAQAHDFFLDPWGAASAGRLGDTWYVRGSEGLPYLVALAEAPTPSLRSITFTAPAADIDALAQRAKADGAGVTPVTSDDLGGGQGVTVRLPDGEVFRFLAGDAACEPLTGRDLPVKLTHVVLNSIDAEATADFCERVLGFRVSDRTAGMVFVRCNPTHHSVAFTRAGYPSLNHIAFEMPDLDGVMRGIGRLRDRDLSPAWGPGRHGPGGNVFGYFVAPFGAVVEFSTPVEQVPDDYRTGAPEDWKWPPGRVDRWGVSAKDLDALGRAERTFRHVGAV